MFDQLSYLVECELLRHGYPSFREGHDAELWFGIPNTLALCRGDENPLEVAREIMWWHSPIGTQGQQAHDL